MKLQKLDFLNWQSGSGCLLCEKVLKNKVLIRLQFLSTGKTYFQRVSTNQFTFNSTTNSSCIRFITSDDDVTEENMKFTFNLVKTTSLVQFKRPSITIDYLDDDSCE